VDPRAVYDEDVEEAVTVVVEERDTARHTLDQILFGCRGIAVFEVDARTEV